MTGCDLIRNLLWCCGLVILLGSGCSNVSSSEHLNIEMKSEKEQREQLESFTYDDYREKLDQVVNEAEEMNLNDGLLYKWVIRVLADEALYMKTDLTHEQVVQLAKERMVEHTEWADYAMKKYNVSIDQKKLDEHISKNADTSEITAHHAYADALGLTLEELNHEFDRDLYERYVIWEQLRPILSEKYKITDDRKLREKYEEEVKDYLKQGGY
ncbi:hypothetical protein ACFO3D_08285 [Virgibacillus kekensis]|uniref:Lipoprotein n=1 Tax=Virgibacillus kekensis TaxID=202261 RepID=A0ABV9DH94_9BACI